MTYTTISQPFQLTTRNFQLHASFHLKKNPAGLISVNMSFVVSKIFIQNQTMPICYKKLWNGLNGSKKMAVFQNWNKLELWVVCTTTLQVLRLNFWNMVSLIKNKLKVTNLIKKRHNHLTSTLWCCKWILLKTMLYSTRWCPICTLETSSDNTLYFSSLV